MNILYYLKDDTQIYFNLKWRLQKWKIILLRIKLLKIVHIIYKILYKWSIIDVYLKNFFEAY
jgi:hypothetical protein